MEVLELFYGASEKAACYMLDVGYFSEKSPAKKNWEIAFL